MNKLALVLVFFLVSSVTVAHAAKSKPTVIIVDKKTNTLTVNYYSDTGYEEIKKFHAVVGKVKGDKMEEGDQKTPEGIYTFNARLTPPTLKPKFGVMAFYVEYPNAWDKIAGRSGFDIMLHATNEPDRLKLDFDSEGCVVVKNEELEQIKPYIRLGLTPILIFAELTPDFLKPDGDKRVKDFFEGWVKAWESRDVDKYIQYYHSDFVAQKKDKGSWRAYKKSLIDRYATIDVGAKNPMFFRHPKYSVVVFEQNYRSTLKNGRPGFKSSGTKFLYVAEEDGQFKIVDESYSQYNW